MNRFITLITYQVLIFVSFAFVLSSCGKQEDIGDTNNINVQTGTTEEVKVIKENGGDIQKGTSTQDRFGNGIKTTNLGKEEFVFDSIEDMDNYDIITLFGGESFSNEKIKIEIRGLKSLDISQYYPGNDCVKFVRDGLLQDALIGKTVGLKNYQNGTADVYIDGENLLDILKNNGAINRGDGQVSNYYSVCKIN